MTLLSQVRGQRVMTVDDARQVGSVRRLVIDSDSRLVVGAHLDGAQGDATLLPWSSVNALGPDALMIQSAGVLRQPDETVRQLIDGGTFDIEGRAVYSDAGDALGPLEDVEFDERSGTITALHVPGHVLPVARLVIGPQAIIVPAEAGAEPAPSF